MAGWVVFLVAFSAYGWTASASIGWLDAPELTAAAACLGVPHSPGEPTAMLLGHAAQLLPVGDLHLRMSLASALAGALAITLFYLALRRLVARLAPALPPAGAVLVAAASALTVGLADAVWLQATRPEVYALTLAACAAMLLVVTTPVAPGPRLLAAAGLALGLGLATHSFIALTFAAPLGLWLLLRRPGWRALGWGLGGLVLGLAVLVYLPLRAARDPLVNWGDPDTLDRFLWTVSGRAFQKSLAGAASSEPWGDDALQAAATVAGALGPLVLLALVGAYVAVRDGRLRGLGLALVGVVVLGVAGRATLGFDFGNPDARGYLAPTLLALAMLAAIGVAVMVEALLRVQQRAAVAAVVLLVATLPAWGLVSARPQQVMLAGDERADRWADGLVRTLPPRALAVSSYFETAFQLWALAVVDGARPDVSHVDRSFHTYPGMAELTASRHPELAGVTLRPGVPTPVAALLATGRPVHVELAETLDAPLVARLAPQTFWASLGDGVIDDATQAARERARPPLTAASAPAAHWHELARARFACRRGLARTAEVLLARLAAALPDDATLADLRTRCAPPG